MTGNQIAYFEAKEQARSNLAREGETHRSNVKNEKLKAATLKEEKRSHKANEKIGAKQARASLKTATANLRQAKAAESQAKTSAYNATTNRMTSDRNYAVALQQLAQSLGIANADRAARTAVVKIQNKSRENAARIKANADLKINKRNIKANRKLEKQKSRNKVVVSGLTGQSGLNASLAGRNAAGAFNDTLGTAMKAGTDIAKTVLGALKLGLAG